VIANARCSPADRADQRVIVIAAEDLVAGAYASVSVGVAKQTGMARGLARSARTMRPYRKRQAHGGMGTLGRAGADQYLSGSFDPYDATA
jgi:hypothetical protein